MMVNPNAQVSSAAPTVPVREALILLDAGLHQVWAADTVMAEIAELAAADVELPEEWARVVRRWSRSSEAVRVGLLAVEAALSILDEELGAPSVVTCA